MRCLALGQAWRDAGGDVVFSTACTNTALLNRLIEEGFDVKGPEELGTSSNGDAWLVLDGYHFEAEYQRRASRQAGASLPSMTWLTCRTITRTPC